MTAFKETAKSVIMEDFTFNKIAREGKIPRVKIEVGRSDKVIKRMCRMIDICNTAYISQNWENTCNTDMNKLSEVASSNRRK